MLLLVLINTSPTPMLSYYTFLIQMMERVWKNQQSSVNESTPLGTTREHSPEGSDRGSRM